MQEIHGIIPIHYIQYYQFTKYSIINSLYTVLSIHYRQYYQFTIDSIINSADEIKKSIKISVEKKGCLLPCSDFRLNPDPYKTNPDSEHCL